MWFGNVEGMTSWTFPAVGVPHDVRVREIAEETVSTSATLGQKGKKFEFGVFPEIAFVTVKVSLHSLHGMDPGLYTIPCMLDSIPCGLMGSTWGKRWNLSSILKEYSISKKRCMDFSSPGTG